MRLLFIDANCPNPYDERTLTREGLGGTEATVVRVTRELAKRHEVSVAQKNREGCYVSPHGVRYTDFDTKRPVTSRPQHVILINSHKLLKRVYNQYPEAKRYLWMHCFPGNNKKHLARWAQRYGYTLVAVSKTHRNHIAEFLQNYQGNPQVETPPDLPKLGYVYNPVDEDIDTLRLNAYDNNKLVYFSSPHKGLKQILAHFEKLRERCPKLELHLANPGYIALEDACLPEGVRVLGSLPQREVLSHVRSALCVFNPQSSFSETFGLVFAEANALGTPVLTHDIGAAREVLGGPEQLVDAENSEAVVNKILGWRSGKRPEVSINPEFRVSAVARAWEATFAPASKQKRPAHMVRQPLRASTTSSPTPSRRAQG